MSPSACPLRGSGRADSRRITRAGCIRSTHSFCPSKVLSRVFRGKFVAGLKRLYREDSWLRLPGPRQRWHEPKQFSSSCRTLFRQDWVVYAKPAFGGPSRSCGTSAATHTASPSPTIGLLAFDGESVTFRWKDYAHGNKQRKMTLTATEFLRRFFLHVLPQGFVRIRHFGFLANRAACNPARPLPRLLAMRAGSGSLRPTAPQDCSPWHCPTMRRGDDHHPPVLARRNLMRCANFDSS